MLVQISTIEQDSEVLQDRGDSSWCDRDLLESLNSLWRSQNATRGVGGDLCGFRVLPLLEEVLELLDEKVVGTRQIGSGCQANSKVPVLQLVYRPGASASIRLIASLIEHTHDVWYHVRLVQANTQDLTLLVDSDDSSSQFVFGGRKDGVPGNSVHVKALPGLKVVQVDESVFRYEINDTMTFRDLHSDGEIASGFGREEHISSLLREYWIGGVVIDFNDVKLQGYGL